MKIENKIKIYGAIGAALMAKALYLAWLGTANYAELRRVVGFLLSSPWFWPALIFLWRALVNKWALSMKPAGQARQAAATQLSSSLRLLILPVRRAAYSNRAAWLMAEMSRAAYFKFEKDVKEITPFLDFAGFDLVDKFDVQETQAFLVKRDGDKIAVLAFRGTEVNKWQDVVTDLDFRFFKGKYGAKVHEGFKNAFDLVKDKIRPQIEQLGSIGYAVYITGHSLGAALALMAAKEFDADYIAACYTFGCPRVGNSEFGEQINAPIYRVVNANDLVPRVPFIFIVELLYWVSYFRSLNFLRYVFSERGFYAHYGDQRYLPPCKEDYSDLRLISNPGAWEARYRYYNPLRLGLGVKHHDCTIYCAKLAAYALK